MVNRINTVLPKIDHFTIVCLVPWPLSRSEAGESECNLFLWYTTIRQSLLTSLFTFFLISIRLNSKKPWPEIWTKCKSWKSWLSWAICAIFSLLKAILKELQLRNCWVAKKLMSHTFFVKFRVFKREFLRNHWVYRAQIFRDNWNCYALSIFRCFILFASSDNDEHMLMRQKG